MFSKQIFPDRFLKKKSLYLSTARWKLCFDVFFTVFDGKSFKKKQDYFTFEKTNMSYKNTSHASKVNQTIKAKLGNFVFPSGLTEPHLPFC